MSRSRCHDLLTELVVQHEAGRVAKVFQEAQGPSSDYRPDGGNKAVGPTEFRTMLSALGLQA